MRAITKFATAAAAALSIAAVGSASQAAVFVSFDGTNDVATDPGGGYFFEFDALACTIIGCGGFESVTVTGNEGTYPTLLHSQNVDVNTAGTGPASLSVWVTRTGITGPVPDFYTSAFTSNNSGLGSTPFTVTLSTYVDFTNGKYSEVNPLSSFTSSSVGASSDNEFAALVNGATGPYSVTTKYVISATASGTDASSSPSIILSAAVPEPATWALMILGFGSAGAMLRRRRQAVVA